MTRNINETVVAVPLDWLKPDKVERRERIATACLQGLLADPSQTFDYTAEGMCCYKHLASEAVLHADALIEELDK